MLRHCIKRLEGIPSNQSSSCNIIQHYLPTTRQFSTAKSTDGAIKSRSYLIPTLKITNNVPFKELLNQVVSKVQLAPQFYKNVPIVIDVSGM
ncbi:hypothetical protein SAMD00019534_060330 [Acytostelium subglobosum LB1]|uniref:hypothetical protein n=1 Tax=Acytostelium subglobosum LB1 TaxID=1410327 RepID=UPI000644B8CE|nr:hypothetical protein SAMD00019534_060330 [Acytostelium subglobosum LB1]GAM22858.1 hypothetical protein SAMD00019534_060330 [Acytostelium subglobosum LB1]|eukprot:XP_012754085.1 hypothetical protein SAMD00019534_060330 [Acytostelium subglobosum LB1]